MRLVEINKDGNMMKVVALVPIKLNSQRLPNKNILPLKGKPLLCYSISYGLESDIVDKVIVSTDSEEFAEIAKSYGADIPFIRPAELAMDNTRDYPFMRHALDYFESIGEIYDIQGLKIALPKQKEIAEFKNNQPVSKIWLGTESVAAAHFDQPKNIACCVAGKRRFTLFPSR